MLLSFEAEKASRYILDAILSFLSDPPDSDFQRGYLAALISIYREGLNKGADDDRVKYLEKILYGERNGVSETVS